MIGSFAFRFRQAAIRQEMVEQKQCHPKAGGSERYLSKNQRDKVIVLFFGKPNRCNIVIFVNILYKNEVYLGAAAACGGTRRMAN
ncbi:MAG: hypothetical protein K9K88_01210 [Desulfobacterales bacterium]|nr:hypothetical protein [Desulfobacterales bacterium]